MKKKTANVDKPISMKVKQSKLKKKTSYLQFNRCYDKSHIRAL